MGIFTRLQHRVFGNPRIAIEAKAPKYDGSVVLFVGKGGCGKTHASSLVLVASSLQWALPAYIQDTTGSVRTRVDGHLRWLRTLDTAKAKRQIEHIESRFQYFTGRDSAKLLDVFNQLLEDTKRTGSVANWQGVCLFDDAQVLRAANSEFFDQVLPLFRNLGLLALVTTHRDKGIPPSARVNVRRVIAWQSSTTVELDGYEFTGRQLNTPKSQSLVYVDPSTGNDGVWNLDDAPPSILTTPGAITTPKATPFKVGHRDMRDEVQ